MDMTDTIIPKSDQINADDLMSGPRTFTITEVRKTGAEDQPVDVHLAEFPPGRPFKPSKSMRRVMVSAWGGDASTYVGKRLTLYRDPNVKWGGQAVGGVRISHMSDLAKPLTLALTETRGKRTPYTVKPLADEPAPKPDGVTDAQLGEIGSGLDALQITEREAKLAAVSQVVKRDLGSARDLTSTEAATVLAWIAAELEPAAETDR